MDTGSTAWILTSTALVLFMTMPGLALFYGGLVKSENVLSVLMHCFGIACVASITWLGIGYSIAFTSGNPYFGDLSQIFLLIYRIFVLYLYKRKYNTSEYLLIKRQRWNY